MRLHHLEVRAFGPFAGTATVDFDELSEAGLFLLSGPTGAGKTSVLDAVCFALYGDVPGDRSSAKRLRCDTAAEGRAPRVVLQATLGGRRFRIARSPQWSRPKKRGSGFTSEQASVLVEERVEGAWVALSSRLDEAGHLVIGLLGMTLPQFCQVAMLPQGRFQAFLRARSEERHKLLQQLFGTQRFEDVERWVRDRSRLLHQQSQECQREVGLVSSRFLEASGAPALGDDDDNLVPWADQVLAAARDEAAGARTALALAEASEVGSAAALEQAKAMLDRQRRHAEATADLDRLLIDEPAMEQRRAGVQAARRAAPLVPLHRHAAETARLRDQLAQRAFAAEANAASELGLDAATADGLSEAAAQASALLARAEALLPGEQERARLHDAVTGAATRERDLAGEHTRLVALLQELPTHLDGVRRELAASREAAVALPAAQREAAELAHRVAARDRIPALEAELAEARLLLESAVHECHTLKESWLDLREARLSGMAAEIAAQLAVGSECPVCGSADHPHKAAPAAGAPDADAERVARALVDDAEVVRAAHDGKVRELATALALTVQQAGDTTDLDAQAVAANRSVEELRAQAVLLVDRERATELLDRQLSTARTDAEATLVELAQVRADLAADRAALALLDGELVGVLDGTGADSLTDLVAVLRQKVDVIGAAVRARSEQAAAAEAADHAGSALAEAAADHGFASAGEALAHVLEPEVLAEHEQLLEAHDRALASARGVLAEPEIAAAASCEVPDIAVLTAAHEAARAALGTVGSRAQLAERRLIRLDTLHAELVTALDAWTPVREAHAVASELASFVEGKSVDNRLRMRLSAYVLAWRLSQVVAAANERLLRMSDQRYTLEHSGQRGAGETRGGLSMMVRDAWSGEARDPATLSGGETFVVSLALALGLADVVANEAGGADLDTLFVDEGFGALDADTLDDVLDTLDTLREGGRVVGVVSHVAEMRTRIPTQLRVAKHRDGSTLALACDPSA